MYTDDKRKYVQINEEKTNKNIKNNNKSKYKKYSIPNDEIKSDGKNALISESNCQIKKNNTFKLRIYSYNSRGFDMIKQEVCKEMVSLNTEYATIICNQENFVLKGNSHKILQTLPNHHIFIKPATKEKLVGRPTNGMFVAVPKEIRTKCTDVSPDNDRLQGIILRMEGDSTLLINTYFPPDPKTMAQTHDEELETTLAIIENMISTYRCRNIVIVGDMNMDEKRKNDRVIRIKKFLSDYYLESAWGRFNIDHTHEFERNQITYTSTLDHIMWNTQFQKAVQHAGVLHLSTNTSDHHPIYCDLKKSFHLTENESKLNASRQGTLRTRTLKEDDWKQFKNQLNYEMTLINSPDINYCKNVHCDNKNHNHDLDDYTEKVLTTASKCISHVALKRRTDSHKAKVVPGWKDIVRPFHDNAKFWNAVWVSAGKPLNNSLHAVMKLTRNRYHYAIRKCKRASEIIIKNKMLDSSLSGKDNIFDCIKKMRRVQNEQPSSIDGSKSPADRFSTVYNKLYNSVEDENDIKLISCRINNSVHEDSLKDVDLITPVLIKEIVTKIKNNKNDPIFSLNTDCIKQAPLSFYTHIANIIKASLIHGHISEKLLIATILPLLKDKKGDIESSDNYRSIALSSVILKIFDWIILTLFEDRLSLDDLQFSYQKDCSTNMCTWMVVESINYFRRNNSNVYACFMDMKKAFDMVKHSTLFKKLIKRNFPPIFLRLLLVMYRSQSANVKWNGTTSNAFYIKNGVKQGAVLSAILFCIYIDDMIKELKRKGEGCWVNGGYVGIIVYADDIVLLSPSIDGLQNMIMSCNKYAKFHNLTFSTHDIPAKSKTKCVAFVADDKFPRKMTLDGKTLPWVRSVKHLGTTLTLGKTGFCSLNQDLLEKRALYIAKNNELCQEFYFSHYLTKVWLNNVYNTSFYGAVLWDFNSNEFVKLEKTWNISIRVMLNLPRTAHRYLIEPLSGTHHLQKSIRRRFLNSIDKMNAGNEFTLKRVLDVSKADTRSTTGMNLRLMKTPSSKMVSINQYHYIPPKESWRLIMAKELLHIRCYYDKSFILSYDEVNELLEDICSS